MFSSRVAALREALRVSDELDIAMRRHSAEILRWEPARFEQVVQAAVWLSTNSVAGLRPRQLQIRGVDTKWFKSLHTVLARVVKAVTGSADLGIVEADRLVRLRVLDSELAPAGITDLAAHRDLWVSDPTPKRAELPMLSATERAALERIRAEGDVRLEQERIPWEQSIAVLR